MRHILDVLAGHIARSPFGEAEFAERVLGRTRNAVRQWFKGGNIPESMVKVIRNLDRVEIHGDRLHVIFKYSGPLRRSPLQKAQLRVRALALKEWREWPGGADSESKQKPAVAAAKRAARKSLS